LQPGAKSVLDSGERSLAGMVVGVSQRVADPAGPDAGQGGPGYLVLAYRHVIGVRR